MITLKQPVIRKQDIFWIDIFAYGLLFGMVILYSAFSSIFAEFYIALPFLNFPIFIGEIVLGILIGLFFWKRAKLNISASAHPAWLVAFVSFILIKAAWGYSYWGPLAFRHSAMYYYVLYAVIAHDFYNSRFISNKKLKVILLIIFLAATLAGWCQVYFLVTYLSIIIMLLLELKIHLGFKLIYLAFLAFCFPFQSLFNTSRGALLAVIVSLLFCLGIYSFFFFSNKLKRLFFVLACCFLIGFVSYQHLGPVAKTRLLPLVKFDALVERYKMLVEASDIILVYYKLDPLEVLPFQPNSYNECIEIFRQRERRNFQKSEGLVYQGLASAGDDVRKQVRGPDLDNLKKRILQSHEMLDEKYVFDGRNELVQSQSTAIWRLLLWTDILDDLKEFTKKPMRLIFGFDFGKPIRSKRQEALHLAYPHMTGWLEPHNAILHVIYRSGLLGVVFICSLLAILVQMISKAARLKLMGGMVLIAGLIYWVVFSMTLVILELPQYAIPFWTLFGFTVAYINDRGAGIRQAQLRPKSND